MSDLSYDSNFDNPDLLSATSLCGHIQAFKYIFNAYQKKKNGESKDQYYLAHSAAASGNLKLLKWIIKNTKCDISDQDPEGLNILHVACLTANINIVQWVLQHTRLSPVTRTNEGVTPLHFAAWSGNIEVTKLMIDTEPRLINMRMVNGATAAMFATQGGFIEIMELLLNEGANFGLPTVDGVNCLHLAAQQGQLEAVKWLVENTGLSLSCKDEQGATPINYAAINNRDNVVKWLVEKEVRLFTDRFGNESSETGSIDRVEEILRHHTNTSVTNICGFTVLDLVQERLKKVFSDCKSSISSTEKGEPLNVVDHCSISINALLLLQSALSELRSQYQELLRQTYNPKKINFNETISRDTQTIEISVDNSCKKETEEKMFDYVKDNIIHSLEITNKNSQSEEIYTRESIIPIPPPPPIAPPLLNPENQAGTFLNKLKETRKQQRLKGNHRRGSSAEKNIKKSLIDELNEYNTMRSKNMKNIDFETTDSDSITSNNETLSLNESIRSYQSTIRGSMTESAPNIFSFFDSNQKHNNAKEIPKWKAALITKSTISNSQEDKDFVDSPQVPKWKQELFEKRGESPDKLYRTNLSEVVNSSPKGSKVIDLVNKWQNSTT